MLFVRTDVVHDNLQEQTIFCRYMLSKFGAEPKQITYRNWAVSEIIHTHIKEAEGGFKWQWF